MSPANTENSVQSPRKRRRPARSCQECRRRKIKCDLKQPCSHCIASRCSCLYNVSKAPVLVTAANAVQLQPLERSPGPPDPARSEPSQTSVAAMPSLLNNQSAPISSRCLPTPSGDQEQELEVLKRRISALEEYIAASTAAASIDPTKKTSQATCSRQIDQQCEPNTANSGLQDRHGSQHYGRLSDVAQGLPASRRLMLNKSRLYGPSHWTHGGNEFKRVAVLNGSTDRPAEVETIRNLRSELQLLIHKCKILARSIKASSPSRSISWTESTLCTVDRGFADQMARLYITHFESAFRILHVPSFWTEYEQYWRSPKEATSILQFKIKLVVAIGSSLYRDAPDADTVRWRSSQWVYETQSWISAPMEKSRICLDGLQIQCLLILARQVLSISGDLLWIAVGTLARTAMQMGLHRDPRHFEGMNILNAEIRRRLWATILEMNVQASLDSGAPLAMSYDDFDTERPGNINDEDIDENTEILSQYLHEAVTDTSLQRLLQKYLRVRMEVIRRVNGFGPDFSQGEIQSITSQLNNACRECDGIMQAENENEVNIFKRNMADLFLRRFLLTLHRQLASAAHIDHPEFYFSRKVCLDSAIALLSPPPNTNFSHLGLLGGGIFKNRIIHVSLALSSELLIDLDENGSTPWLSNYRRMLIDEIRESLRQTAGRIQLGETNIHLHMKLRVVLCRAEWLEPGISLQQRMMQAAKESLETSYSTMQARLEAMTTSQHQNVETFAPQDFDPQDLDFSIDQGLDELFGTIDFGVNGIID
ncbi:putative transcriptional regulatory protein C417,09c [Talaromyces islandicus]|uniref:Putative transcriptional regulatory protein C417,09c n=1 Tax=Talaromyces islandicus TaxID=28573 RepID=A0A0U1LQH8_TALIS|nr:putative transcriptional regulatory protein C417,09c [Talaromyces islandicus]